MRRPMSIEMTELFESCRDEPRAIPSALCARDPVPIDADEIVGIYLAASPRRDCRAGLRDENRALGVEVIRGDAARRGLVIVAGQQEVDPGIGNRLESMLGAADDGARGCQRRRSQWMIAEEDAEGYAGKLSEAVAD